ncbi:MULTISPECIES: disulfide bond formation protein B [Alphaproteobacteria]|jgi:disulfide bond formation protein DsbB|uniref:Disulfide bond formation protein B n=1 Tax=Brucella anthropi TaxID=529 RepID=A0A6I0DN96_BRUAN|nr:MULTISPECIES: disulfide bond formation protein B [Alphaproteobacteria]KAB2792232.1 disulfide bond formation protein B [Brucella anthropi]MDX4076142.1 disulfide bond formation protein B [Brucella sp. NBRC 113783]
MTAGAGTTANAWAVVFLAWFIALAASLGALFIGEIMGQTPCNLCWYQRAFMFPLAVILAVASFRGETSVSWYGLPLTTLGAAIAAFHSLLYAGIIPAAIEPCGQDGPSCSSADMTILGVLPLPYLSLVAFLSIALLLILARRRRPA